MNALATSGSNWLPVQRSISLMETSCGRLRRYARSIPREDLELTLGAWSALGQLEREMQIRKGSLREHWEKATASD